MRRCLFVLCACSLFVITSCVDIIDDLTIHPDGSGVLRYSVNLSSSKAKVNSILALDSLNGKPVPSKDEVKRQIALFKLRLSEKEGITNITIQEDYTNYLFKIQCEFSDIVALQTAVKQTISEISTRPIDTSDYDQPWIIQKDEQLSRHIPLSIIYHIKKLDRDNSDQLKHGTYTSITRFDTDIIEFDNPLSQLSKSNQALLIRSNIFSLLHDPQLLDNDITLKK